MGLTNMLRMEIDCIVHKEGTQPQVFHFFPDPEFPFQDEDKTKPTDLTERKHPKMTILNYKNNHFNLIVEKHSMIAELGRFSHQKKTSEKSFTKPENNQNVETKLITELMN